MRHKNKTLAGFLLVVCIALPTLPSRAQMPSPFSQALSSASMTASQELSAATAETVTRALTPKTQPPPPATSYSSLSSSLRTNFQSEQAPTSMPGAPEAQTLPSQAMPMPRPYNASRTLFIEVAQRRLALEAPPGMCFLDHTSSVQQGIFSMFTSEVESRGDQSMLAVFMPCDDIESPAGWREGMPDMGFITWLNPFIGDVTPMSLSDYLDMREASFVKYAKGRHIGTTSDKRVHRNEYNVSLAFSDEQALGDGTKQTNISVIATTLLRQVPVEITLHLRGNTIANKAVPDFSRAYAMMDQLVARLIKLSE